MKLYNEHYPAPNPRKVRIFLAEKGLNVDLVHVPMRDRAHKTPEFLAKNGLGQLPVLETDDGQVHLGVACHLPLSRGTASGKAAVRKSALDKAMIEMWIRRAEFRLWAPISQAWRNDDPRTEAVVKTRFQEFGQYSRTQVAEAMNLSIANSATGGRSSRAQVLDGRHRAVVRRRLREVRQHADSGRGGEPAAVACGRIGAADGKGVMACESHATGYCLLRSSYSRWRFSPSSMTRRYCSRYALANRGAPLPPFAVSGRSPGERS